MKNIDVRKGLVNGSRGIVTSFDATRRGFPRVLFTNGEERVIEPEQWTMQVIHLVYSYNIEGMWAASSISTSGPIETCLGHVNS